MPFLVGERVIARAHLTVPGFTPASGITEESLLVGFWGSYAVHGIKPGSSMHGIKPGSSEHKTRTLSIVLSLSLYDHFFFK